MRILYVTAEVAPYSKVGGLADVAASLPRALASLGHEVRVISPAHSPVASGDRTATASLSVMGREEALSMRSVEPGIYLVENAHFGDGRVYGAGDDLLRYYLFSLAVLAAPRLLGWRPDIIHCNDWHTAWVPLGLRNYAWSDEAYRGIASVLTIHNLAYRAPDALSDILGPGIYYADAVNTVSPTYAREITTPEYGYGLQELLRLKGDRLHGILNGIDTDLYDPSVDPVLPVRYSADNPEERTRNKAALQASMGLEPEPCTPLVGMVSRLDQQKGLDLLLPIVDRAITDLGLQFAILGSGSPEFQEGLRRAAERHQSRMSVEFGFRDDLAPLIYAGADLFLMPSRFEPCGLGQLIAMRYGAVPLVRRTGGLADTVADASPDLEEGTGFVFEDYRPEALLDALRRAVEAYREQPRCPPGSWRRLVQRAMGQDFSWGASARQYAEMYRQALAH